MRRSRLSSLLAAAGLADRDVAIEQARATRDSNNFRTATDALRSLVPVAVDAFGAHEKRVQDAAALEGTALVNENLTLTGDDTETPEQLASRLVSKRKTLAAEPEESDSVTRFVNDPLGFHARAKKTAAVKAQGDLARQIQGNRNEAGKLARATSEKEAERKHALDLVNARATTKNIAAAPAVDDDERTDKMASALDTVGTSLANDTPLSKAAQAQDKAERTDARAELSQLAAFAKNPKTQGLVSDEGWAQLERIGIQKPKATAKSPSTGPKPLTDKERTNKARADIAESKAADAKRKAGEALSLESIPTGFRVDDTTKRQLQKARTDAVQTQAAAKQIRTLIAKYPDLESYVGPVDGVAGFIANKLGLSSKEASEIASTIDRSFTVFKVAATGASAGIKEMADLENQVPNRGDSLAQIIGKLDAGDAIVAQGLTQIDSVLASGDVRATGGTTTPTTSDKVTVTNGTETFRIPRAQLGNAKADGFREVTR